MRFLDQTLAATLRRSPLSAHHLTHRVRRLFALLLVALPLGVMGGPAWSVPRALDRAGVGAVSPVLTSISDTRVSADGAYLYAVSFDGALSVFQRDPGSGRLILVQIEDTGSTGLLGGARSLIISPDGAHIYVAASENSVAGRVVAYSRDAASGALAFVEYENTSDGAHWVTVSPDGAHVYVATFFGSAIDVYARDGVTGALTSVETVRDGIGGVDGLAGAQSVVVSPDGNHVYTAGFHDSAVAVFSRDAGTGGLAFVEVERDGVAGVDGLEGTRAVTISPDGAHVYAASERDDSVAVFDRDPGTGALTFVEVQRDGVAGADGLDGANEVITTSDGAFVYVVSHSFFGGEEAVAVFARDAGTGALTFVEVQRDGIDGSDPLLGPQTLSFSPDESTVYVASWESDEGVAVFTRDGGTGVLDHVTHVTQPGASGIALSPDGTDVYTVGGFPPQVALWDRDPVSGELTFVTEDGERPGGPQELGGATAVAVSPDGGHVYVASSSDNAVVVFARDGGTGFLTFLEEQKNGVGGVDGLAGALSLAVSPDGGHVYVAGRSVDTVAAFARDVGTGLLTFLEVERDEVGGVDGLDGASSLAVSPDGAHIYVVGQFDDAVATFARDAGTGLLTFLAVERDGVNGVDGLAGALAVTVSPDGAHVYVTSTSDSAIVAFARDSGTGLLAFVELEQRDVDGATGFAGGPVITSPDGEMVYVATGAGVVGFARTAATGALTYVNVASGFGRRAAAMSPDGAHLYAGLNVYAPGFQGCSPAPEPGCRTAGRGSLVLTANSTATWRWVRGNTDIDAFGDPASTTHYAFCIYDESLPTPSVLLRALVPAGGDCDASTGPPDHPCWRVKGSGAGVRLRYRDRYGTPEGITNMLLKPGAVDRARIVVRAGRGRVTQATFPLPPLPLPLRAQLQTSTGECWEAIYSSARKNGPVFRAVAD